MTTIYVVLGSTGEWADASTWNVCYKTTKEAAEEARVRCQKEADDYYKWRQHRRPQKSFMRRHNRLEQEEYAAEEAARRAAMFDKFFSCDYTGTRYRVDTLSEDPATDPMWISREQWWVAWQAEQVAEQLKHCTVDDRSPFAKLGDLLKSKLTIR